MTPEFIVHVVPKDEVMVLIAGVVTFVNRVPVSECHPETTLNPIEVTFEGESVWRSVSRLVVRCGDHSAQEDGCTCHMCALVTHKLPCSSRALKPKLEP